MENSDVLFASYETSLATLAPLEISMSVHGAEMNTSMGEVALDWAVMRMDLGYLVEGYEKLASELSKLWRGSAAEATQGVLKKYTAWISEIINVINTMINSIVKTYSCYQRERPNVVEPQVIRANRAEATLLGILGIWPNRLAELNVQYEEYRMQNINAMTVYCRTAAAAAKKLQNLSWPEISRPIKSARRSAPKSLADQSVSAEAGGGRTLAPEHSRTSWGCAIS